MIHTIHEKQPITAVASAQLQTTLLTTRLFTIVIRLSCFQVMVSPFLGTFSGLY